MPPPLEPASMDLPIIDLDLFLTQPRHTEVVVNECKKVSTSMQLVSILY